MSDYFIRSAAIFFVFAINGSSMADEYRDNRQRDFEMQRVQDELRRQKNELDRIKDQQNQIEFEKFQQEAERRRQEQEAQRQKKHLK
jgi:uncharacterized protein (DUF3084 family)